MNIGGRHLDNNIRLSVFRFKKKIPRYRFLRIADSFVSKLATIDTYFFTSSLAQGRASRALYRINLEDVSMQKVNDDFLKKIYSRERIII